MSETRQQNPDDEQAPGGVSDQNAEEQPGGVTGGEQQGTGRSPQKSSRGGDGGERGESREGSQSTGNPDSAG